ncbi:MAG TPA: alpha/beta fold hydrolase [Steroidobacteraceae bacterium]|nr:alpha/beta fold hydrolase [Steroidobacteraceae bacterium]
MSFRPPQPQRLLIPGPAGNLEAIVEDPTGGAARRCGVVCHPHPQFGGTMDNKVIHTLARTLQELGIPTVRFNFRGVGKSEGIYAEGDGETDDAVAVIDWSLKRWPGAALWLAGFSFGASIAVRASARRPAAVLITVAPAIQRLETGPTPGPETRWLLIQGDQDELVNHEEVIAWARKRSPPPQVTVLPGVTHYFHGRLQELKAAVLAFVGRDGN